MKKAPQTAIAILAASALGAAAASTTTTQSTFGLNLEDGVTVTSYQVGDVQKPIGEKLWVAKDVGLVISAAGKMTIEIGTDADKIGRPAKFLVVTSDGKEHAITLTTFEGKIGEQLGTNAYTTYWTPGFDTTAGKVKAGEILGANLKTATFPEGLHLALMMPALLAGHEDLGSTANMAKGAITHAAAGATATA